MKKKKKKMEKKQKLFIFLGCLILMLFCLGVYVNYQLEGLLNSWKSPGSRISDLNETGYPDANNGEPDTTIPGAPSEYESGSYNGTNPPNTEPGEAELPSYKDIARDVQSRVGRPIEKTDMLRVGLILVRRLDRSEIKYLYNVGRRGTYTRAELEKSRHILTTRLNENDMKVLREMAVKYDQPLFFLVSE